jgi:recombinational DNA repair protein RecR
MIQTSKILEDAVHCFNSLPGIGRKTAMRLALHLATQEKHKVLEIGNSLPVIPVMHTLILNYVQFALIRKGIIR